MPQTAVKLIWAMSACNFCPRSDVRTCQVKPGKLLSKLSTALQLEESSLGSCAGICTCCLADIDMIIRAVAIRGAMKDYFMDMRQSIQRGFNPTVEDNSYFNGHYQSKPVPKVEDGNSDNQANLSINVPEENEGTPAPPLPALIAKPSFMKNSPEELALSPDTVPLSLSVTPTKKYELLHISLNMFQTLQSTLHICINVSFTVSSDVDFSANTGSSTYNTLGIAC